ncbi:unnamed protein product [Heterobilharzia americana]|nr:unnamed protein product [Heterobilharzia americana]
MSCLVPKTRRSTGKNQQVDRRGRTAKMGLQGNVEKTEVMKITKQQQHQQQGTNHHQREKSNRSSHFHLPTYLGSIISTTDGTGTHEDVKVSQHRKDSNTRLPALIRNDHCGDLLHSTTLHSAQSVNNIRIFNTNVSQVSASTWFRDFERCQKHFQQPADIHE